EIKVVLDGITSQQTFAKMYGLQKHYTFHSTSEYTLWIPPPARPALEGIQTLHNLTVELGYTFSSTPDGNGIISQIIFETFTPPTLDSTTLRPLVLLQEKFSWEIGLWSFGRCFFNTSVLIPFSNPQNVSLLLTTEFSGLTLEGWQIIIEQGAIVLQVRDNQTLQGVLALDPARPCELRLMVDPPQVSEPDIISVRINVQGMILSSPVSSSPSTYTLDPASEKRFSEGIILLQVGLVILPLLTYYRIRRPSLRNDRQEENK
ncbi:MAG: hypothetical protein ACFFBD_06845, partial [Candidatus Hodarchaeota archaeon]